ncbi:MAG: hypothetical protein AAF434_05560 [Pseudomonadota bacterium]
MHQNGLTIEKLAFKYMDEILNSINAYFRDRASSPLIGAFTFSWVVWNFEVIVILFSGEGLTTKLEFIDRHFSTFPNFVFFSTHGFEWALYGFNWLIIPVVLTIVYLYGYPIAAKPVYKFHLKQQTQLREIKKEAQRKRVLDQEEANAMFVKMAKLEEKHIEEVSDLRSQIRALTEELERVSLDVPDRDVDGLTRESDSGESNHSPSIPLEEPHNRFFDPKSKLRAATSKLSTVPIEDVREVLRLEIDWDKLEIDQKRNAMNLVDAAYSEVAALSDKLACNEREALEALQTLRGTKGEILMAIQRSDIQAATFKELAAMLPPQRSSSSVRFDVESLITNEWLHSNVNEFTDDVEFMLTMSGELAASFFKFEGELARYQ